MKITTLIAALCGAFFYASASLAGPDRISVLFGSNHVNAKADFEEFNLGVFATIEGRRFDYSAGIYRNSYGRASIAATVGYRFAEWDGGAASVFGGVAHYPIDGRTFGVHAGDFVPIGGFQVRHKNLFIQAIPQDGVWADAVIAAGLIFAIK
jgi:hypothetical protein